MKVHQIAKAGYHDITMDNMVGITYII